MKLRPATMEDAAMLLDWRNDPATREASVNGDPTSWEDHLGWLRASLANPRRRLLVAETDRPVGVVRIDYGEETELSWTVAPEARGKGYGRIMVDAAMPDGPLVARIKRENTASQRIAAAVGLTLAKDGALQLWTRG